jgi:hypothetical protein
MLSANRSGASARRDAARGGSPSQVWLDPFTRGMQVYGLHTTMDAEQTVRRRAAKSSGYPSSPLGLVCSATKVAVGPRLVPLVEMSTSQLLDALGGCATRRTEPKRRRATPEQQSPSYFDLVDHGISVVVSEWVLGTAYRL